MRVCIISHGIHRHTQLVAEGLAALGFHVLLVYTTTKHLFKPRFKVFTFTVVTPPKTKLTIYARLILFRYNLKILRDKVDASIYVGYPVAHLLPFYLPKSARIFMPITAPLTLPCSLKRVYYLPYFYMVNYAVRKADLLVTISKFMREAYLKAYKRDSLVIPPPVNEKLFKPNFKLKRENIILHVGRYVPHKGQLYAIRLFNILKNVYTKKHIKLILAGLSAKKNYLLHVISEAKKVKDVKVMINIPDHELIRLYQSATVLWWPIIDYEPFGMPLIEALACGTPVISFNRPAANEIIDNGISGFLVNNEREFLEKTICILEDKRLRGKMQKNAIRKSKKYFVKTVSKLWAKTLKQLVQ